MPWELGAEAPQHTCLRPRGSPALTLQAVGLRLCCRAERSSPLSLNPAFSADYGEHSNACTPMVGPAGPGSQSPCSWSGWGGCSLRAPEAWGASRAKPTQQVRQELGGPCSIPAPHPCRPRVTLFQALRTAWGDKQRGQCSALPSCVARPLPGSGLLPFSGGVYQNMVLKLQGAVERAKEEKGLHTACAL